MAGMKWDMLADTRQAQKAIGDVSEALDEVAASLDDVVKDSNAGTERVERDFRELARAAETQSRKVYESLRDNVKKGARESSDTMKEVRSEFLQNSSETLSSFSGDISDIGAGIQGVLGGLVIGLADKLPLAAAVAAGAGGLGLVLTALSQQQQAAEALREQLISAYKDAASEGRSYLDQAQIIAAANDVLFDTSKRENAAAEARKIGVDLITYVRAQAGDQAALNEVIEKGNALLEEAGKIQGDKSRASQSAALDEKQALEAIVRENEKLLGIHEEGAEAARLAQQLTAEQQAATRAELSRTQQAEADRWNELGNQYRKAQGLPPLVIPTQLAKPDTTALDKVIKEYQQKGLTVPVDTIERKYGRTNP